MLVNPKPLNRGGAGAQAKGCIARFPECLVPSSSFLWLIFRKGTTKEPMGSFFSVLSAPFHLPVEVNRRMDLGFRASLAGPNARTRTPPKKGMPLSYGRAGRAL